jgi:hypothetical protein
VSALGSASLNLVFVDEELLKEESYPKFSGYKDDNVACVPVFRRIGCTELGQSCLDSELWLLQHDILY